MENNLLNQDIEDNAPSVTDLVSELLKKYGFEEKAREAYEKIDAGIVPHVTSVCNLSRDFANNKISEKILYSSLQKEFNATDDISQKMVNDIKNIVLPAIIKIKAKTVEKRSSPKTETAKIYAPVRLETKISPAKPIQEKPASIEVTEISKIPKKSIKKITEPPASVQKKGPDSYLEPIE